MQPGDDIDGFRLIERLYSGNMSAIWRVSRAESDLPLVMKLPKFGYGGDPTAIVGFEQEQMIHPTLSGPHVPAFVATADFTRQAYLVTEFIAGDCLADSLTGSPLPLDRAIDLGGRVAAALQALHAQHVIHLDLKPRNVIFRPGGEAVLIDFGLAHHSRLPDLLAEEFRLPMGTAAYIAPEQVRRIRHDPRSDIFSLGVLLYVMVTGREPFGNPMSLRGLRKRLWQEPRPPRSLNPDVPPWLQEIVLGCLETDPAKRWGTAAQVAFLLRHPDQVPLSGRASRLRRGGPLAVLRRWLDAHGADPAPPVPVLEHLAQHPIIAVAVETRGDPVMVDAVRTAAGRLMQSTPQARLACLSVLKTARLGIELDTENRHVKALVDLKHWAHALELAPERVTHHVLEAADLAEAILDYCRTNHVDHLIIGARATRSVRAYLGGVQGTGPVASQIASLGPVATQIVAEAPCTVTVVKTPKSEAE